MRKKIRCGLCGAPVLLNVAFIVESDEGEFYSEEIHPCSNKGCGLFHNKKGEVMTMNGDGLFYLHKDDEVSISGKERTLLM